jgi:membrane fusion protein (multidrug efflux system)
VFDGVVRGIDTRIDPVTRSVQVRALLPNPARALRRAC